MEFNHEMLPELFEGIRKGKSHSNSGFDFNYYVSAAKGDIAQITYLGKNEWRFYIDNFPMQKLWYQTNFPLTTIERFISEMKHIGLDLKLKNPSQLQPSQVEKGGIEKMARKFINKPEIAEELDVPTRMWLEFHIQDLIKQVNAPPPIVLPSEHQIKNMVSFLQDQAGGEISKDALEWYEIGLKKMKNLCELASYKEENNNQ